MISTSFRTPFFWSAATAVAFAAACAPALRTPAEIVEFARQPGVGDLDRLFDALRSPLVTMRSHAAWALGSRAIDNPGTTHHPIMAKHLVRAFDAEWKRPGGPDAAVLGQIIRAIGNAGEAEDGEHVAGFMRVLSPSLQGAVAQMALGFAARKIQWWKQLDGAVGTIAAAPKHPHRKLALIAAARASKTLAASTLEDALKSSDAEIRAVAAKLARLSTSIAVNKLDQVLQQDGDWRVQAEAARSLVHRGEPARVADFAARLWRHIRQRAEDLESTKGIVLLSVLESLFAAKSLSPSARSALHEIHAVAKGASLTTAWVYCRAAIILDAADKSGARTRECGGAQMPASRRAGLAADLATKLPRESAAVAELLAPFLASPDAKVRAAILPAVVRLSAEKARAMFLDALAGPDPVVAAVAADTIAQQPPKYYIRPDLGMAAMAAARRHAKSEDVEAIITLVTILGQYRPGVVDDLLQEFTSHAEPSVVAAAVAALSVHGITASPKFTRPASWSRLDVPVGSLPRTAQIETSKGSIRLQLHTSETPRTVANFVALARKGFFNGLEFHRVVPNFVIQGGDPRGDGWGGPGHTIPCEPSFGDRTYTRGSVGMALAGRHTGGSQFFITHSAQPHLDGRYTYFATVTAGMDVVDRIVVGDKILRVTID